MALGDVIFTAKLDTKQFKKDLRTVKSDGEKIGLSVSKNLGKSFRSDFKNFMKGTRATTAELEKAFSKAVDARKAYSDAIKEYSDFSKKANSKKNSELFNLGSKKAGLEKQLAYLKKLKEAKVFGLENVEGDKGWGNTSGVMESVEEVEAQIEETTRKMEELRNAGWTQEDIATAEQYKRKIAEAGTAMLSASKVADGLARGANSKIGKKFGAVIDSIKAKIKSIPHAIASALKKGAITAIKAPIKLFKGIFATIWSGLKAIPSLASRAFGSIAKWARRIALGGIIAGIAMLKKGMDNLVKSDATTAQSINSLKGALASLGNAFASAFAPILNAVAPILTKFIGMLVSAANAVASFISALLGKKFVVQANNVSSGIDGIGDSASGANDSAKELQRTLMGFDKINKLDGENKGSSGGGSGGSSGAGGGGFSLVPVSDQANEWADKFKESWESANFYWLGELLANKLNEALEKIPWDKIQDGARRLAGSLATFLNGFIENADWTLVGETIAQALNTAVYFAQEFVHTFNWSALGKAIADAINGFISKTDWSAIGDTIGTAIVGALNTLNEAIKNVDWAKIGASIVEMLSSIDWVGILTGAVNLVGNIVTGIFQLLQGAILKAKEKLASWISSGKIWDDLFEIGSAVVEVGVKLLKNGWSTISAFVGTAVSVATSLFKSGWDSITKFVGNAVTVATSLSKNGWSSISNFVGSVVNVGVKLFKRGWKSISSFVGTTVSVGIKLVKSGWKSLSSWIGNLVKVGIKLFKKAMGGVYKNGKWSPIQKYASGGSPNGGQMFIAREAGPELVGTLGGHTAVMNNDQIVASVSAGVAKAIAGIRFKMVAPKLANTSSYGSSSSQGSMDIGQVTLLLNQILTAINNKDTNVYLDGESIKDNTVRRINNHTRATGQLELII